MILDSLLERVDNPIAIVILFLIGVVFIVKGGDWFVDSASWIADVSGVPKFIIGATIVSVATTLPELLVSTMAAVEGQSDMAIGNAVGSVTANVGLIMALSMLLMPTATDKKKIRLKVLILFAAVVVLWITSSLGAAPDGTAAVSSLTVAGSIPIFILFALFIAENIRSVKQEIDDNDRPEANKKLIIKNVAFLIIGALCIVFGSNLLVFEGTEIARMLKINENIIGLTAIAIGTSLPELVTTITSVVKKQPSLGMGNIIGANIIDICLILPICSFIQNGSLPITAQNLRFDFPVCLIVVLIAMLPPLITGKIRRWQGFVALGVYLTYLGLVCFGANTPVASVFGILPNA